MTAEHVQPRVAATAVREAARELPAVPQDAADVPRMPLAVRDTLGPGLLATAREALAASGTGDAGPLGCVTAFHHATDATAAYIAEVLDRHGPRWLAPECFLHYSPHSLTGLLCIGLGLAGTAVTLTGPAGGVDALGYAASLIASGRCGRVLVASAHWPPPAGPADPGPVPLRTAAVVLTGTGGRGEVTGWRPGGGHPAVRNAPGDEDDGGPDRSDPGEALTALAGWHHRGAAAPLELTGGGSRLLLRPGGTG